jgi:CO dehydrogenase/acetyl-CoA synthase epsilon subunit
MKRFRVVPTAEAEEGMCLYEDVRDRSGNILLPRLVTLTGATIKSLLRRDVEALLIVDDSITEEQLAAERAKVQERLEYLCRHAGNGRANLLLRKVVEDYRIAELT